MLEQFKDRLGNITEKINVDEIIDKVKEVAESEEGRQKINEVKEKVTEFISEKIGKK